MAAAGRSGSYREPVNEAIRWLREHSITSCDGLSTSGPSSPRNFVPQKAVRSYFNYHRLIPILDSVLPAGSNSGHIASQILDYDAEPGDGYLFVFLILLTSHQAADIEAFLYEDMLSDKHLPYRSRDLFPHGIDFNAFKEHQSVFCAPAFSKNRRKHFSSDTVLPIEERVPIEGGQSATLSRIKLNAEFDHLERDGNNYYVLKTFTGSEGKRQFESETLGYIETQSSGGPIASLLKYYGTYTHGDDEYNLVLEYADGGTWEEFMKAHSPPGREQDIISVWKSLLDVSQALHRAHLGNGIHQDVTSRNLLLKKRPLANNYGFDIKLGDFGSSNFHGHKEPGQPSLLRDMRGTKENGAPECFRRTPYDQTTRLYVLQTADVWSLGTIFSEACKWMTEGWAGVERYRNARLKEVQQLHLEPIPFFHDGAKRLECVDEVHQHIDAKRNQQDPVTSPVAHSLLGDMLHEDPHHRLSSKDLVKRIQNIVDPLTAQRSWHDTPTKLKKTRTEPMYAERTDQQNRRTQSMQVGTFSTGDFGKLVETPIRNLSLSDHPSAPNASHAREKRPSGAQRYVAHQAIPEDDENLYDRASYGTHGPVTESPEPAHASIFGQPSTAHRTPKTSGTIFRESSVAGGNSGLSHSRTDSQTGSVYAVRARRAPCVNISAAYAFINERKSGNHLAQLLHAPELKGQLRARDHLFLLDSSFSASRHWADIRGVFEALSFIVEDDDPDGVEVHFTTVPEAKKISKLSSDLATHARTVQPRGDTNLEDNLKAILTEYENKLYLRSVGKLPSPVRPLSIYILTDGKWEGGGNPEVPMLGLAQSLKDYNLTRQQIGIEFITFGDDQGALLYMQNLDDMGKNMDLQIDFVDAEPSNGNVWKMLLGAINDYFDNLDEPEASST